jgi:hypothetical protein
LHKTHNHIVSLLQHVSIDDLDAHSLISHRGQIVSAHDNADCLVAQFLQPKRRYRPADIDLP